MYNIIVDYTIYMVSSIIHGNDGVADMSHNIIRCHKCNKILCKAHFSWDAGGGEVYYCLKCMPLTKDEKEALEFAKFKALRKIRK